MNKSNRTLEDKRGDKFATLIIFGFGIMFSSTLFQGVVGSTGRIQILTSGFAILVIGMLGLLQTSFIVKRSRLGITAATFLIIMGLSYAREHSIFDFRPAAFILIALACFVSGQLLGALSNIRDVTFDLYLLILLAVFLSGSLAWYALIDVRSLEIASRISGDEDLHPVGVAYVMACCMVMTAAIGLFSQGRLSISLALATLPLLALNLLATGSRGALVALLVTLIFIFRAYVYSAPSNTTRPKLSPKRVTSLCAAAAIPVIVVVLTTTESVAEQADFVIRRLQSLGDVEGDASASERIYIWSEYASRFREFWLFGLPNYNGPYPHNIFYEMWLRFGLAGLSLAISTAYLAVTRIRRSFRVSLSPLDVLMTSLFILGFVNGQFNISLESNRLFWFGMGYLLVRNYKRKAQRPPVGDALRKGSTNQPMQLYRSQSN